MTNWSGQPPSLPHAGWVVAGIPLSSFSLFLGGGRAQEEMTGGCGAAAEEEEEEEEEE